MLAFKKKFLYFSKWETNLNRLWSIFILLSDFLAGVFLFGDEGAICRQSEKATTTKHSICILKNQYSVSVIGRNSRTDNILQKVLMMQSITSPKGQTYVNETYHDEYGMTQNTQDRSTQNQINITQQTNSIILNQLNKVSSNEMGNNQSIKPKPQTFLNTQTHIWSKSQTTPNP